jgi:hypothetical protein
MEHYAKVHNVRMPSRQDPDLLLYQTEDGQTRIDVRIDGESAWLTQGEMAELFQKDQSVIARHIQNIFLEGELPEENNMQKMHIDRSKKPITLYNLDVIISVGYRVKSHRGTQFRIWATKRLREYLIKGFTLDDHRLKESRRTDSYFDELLERVREIRTSERLFYKKVADIYATSIDYDPDAPQTHEFFATTQNKFHYAIHGHTAPEIIALRANAKKPHMGLTSWKGDRVKACDVTIAKNYLTQDELKQLNLLVDQYLSFAELQAHQRRPMYMKDWSSKLHAFLNLNERQILADAGRVSRALGEELAKKQYALFEKDRRAKELDDSALDRAVKSLEAGRRGT